MCDPKCLPLVNIVVGDVAIVLRLGNVSCQAGDHGHGLDGDHAFEGQVGLVSKICQSV